MLLPEFHCIAAGGSGIQTTNCGCSINPTGMCCRFTATERSAMSVQPRRILDSNTGDTGHQPRLAPATYQVGNPRRPKCGSLMVVRIAKNREHQGKEFGGCKNYQIIGMAMRHSTIDLTMNVYTDPKLLDFHGALNSLPSFEMNSSPIGLQTVRVTGTDNQDATPFQRHSVNSVAPNVA